MTETATSYTSYFVSTMSIIIWRSGQLLLGLTTVVLAGLYFKQDSLLYHPEIGNMPRDPAKNPRGYRSPACLLYTSPSPRDLQGSRMPSSA